MGTRYPLGLSYFLKTQLSWFGFHPYGWESFLSMKTSRARLSSTSDFLAHVVQAALIQLAVIKDRRGGLKPLTLSPEVNYKMLLPITEDGV